MRVYKDFEEFITYKFSEAGVHKDDAQDWLWNQEPTELIKWANEYAEGKRQEGWKEGQERIKLALGEVFDKKDPI